MRLAAQAKMGYYPTPEKVSRMIAAMLTGKGNMRLLDPCAGEGSVLKIIGEKLGAETCGIEIDTQRAAKAKRNLNHCLVSDYQGVTVSSGAFSLLYLNPPYDWAVKNDDVSLAERYERTFLRNTLKYLIPGGILVYLIPIGRLDRNIAGILAWRFSDIQVFRFPPDEYVKFKQLVIFGVLRKKGIPDEETAKWLTDAGEQKVSVPFLGRTDVQYHVPPSPIVKNFLFRTIWIEPEELMGELRQSPLTAKIAAELAPLSLSEKIRPVMPLRNGHLAQLLSCGLMNGVVFDSRGENPVLIKGITKKMTVTKTEYENGKEKITETDRIIVSVNGMNEFGEIFRIS